AEIPARRPMRLLNVPPVGSGPVSANEGVGVPVAVIMNDPIAPAVNAAAFALVMMGATPVETTDEPQIDPVHARIVVDAVAVAYATPAFVASFVRLRAALFEELHVTDASC